MPIEIYDFEQNSPEWFRTRMGIPTASEFSTVMASGRDGGESKTRKTYMYKLAGEIVTCEPMEAYSNPHMERGKVMEDEAREFYCFTNDAEAQRVGFVRNGTKGCSPDSFIGQTGMVEIKTALPHILIDLLVKDKFPPEHKAQCQGALWVCEREWIDIICYWPGVPKLVKRAFRDEVYIKGLSDAVDAFNTELAALVERVRSYGKEAIAA